EGCHEYFVSGNDPGALAFVLREIGQVYLQQENYEQAHDSLEQSLAIYREIDAVQGTAQSLFWSGMLALKTGDPERARDRCEEALSHVRQISDRAGEVQCLRGVGLAYQALGDLDTARDKLGQALRLAQQPGPTQLESMILQSLYELNQARPVPPAN